MPTKAQLLAELELTKARLLELEPETETPATEAEPRATLDEGGDEAPHRSDIDEFLEEVGAAGAVGLIVDGYRYDDEGDGKLKYVYRWPKEEWSLRAVKDQYGGGRWHFRLKEENGKHIKAKNIVIEGSREVAPPEEDDPRGLMERVLDQNAIVLETLQEVRKGPPAELAHSDPMTMAFNLVGAMEAVVAPLRDALLAKQSGGNEGFAEMFKVFKQGMELGQSSTAPAGGSPMDSAVASMLPMLAGAIVAPSGSTPTVDAPLANPPEHPAADSSPPAPVRPGWDVMLLQTMPTLLTWARKGKAPDLRAAFIVDELPPEAEGVLLEQLRKGEAFLPEFLTLHPEAKPWEPWFREFWLEIANQFEWGSPEMGPHPFHGAQVDLEEQIGQENGHPEGAGGVEVGTH